jgi:hypothetical protein
MLAGFAENRPLLKALKRIRTDPALNGAEPYMLAFDAHTATTRLTPIRSYLEGVDVEVGLQRLDEAFAFSAPDYAALADLRKRGYGEITLLTDQLRVQPIGFKAIELGFAVDFSIFPTAVRFDRASESWLVALSESDHRATMSVSRWDKAAGVFTKLLPDRFTVEDGAAGRILRFSAPGLYLLSFRGPYGLGDIDLPIRLPSRTLDGAAVGSFSERMLSVFPDVSRSAQPSFVMVDAGTAGPSGLRRVITALISGPERHVLNPAETGGALIAAGALPGVDLALGTAARQNDDLVMAYESHVAQRPAPFLHTLPGGTEEAIPVGTTYLARRGSELVPLVPPASQFFETRPDQILSLPEPHVSRWPWVLLLVSLAALKLFLWTRLTGKAILSGS